jgi:hypothetical protein
MFFFFFFLLPAQVSELSITGRDKTGYTVYAGYCVFPQSCDLRTETAGSLLCVLGVLNAYTHWTSVYRLIRRTYSRYCIHHLIMIMGMFSYCKQFQFEVRNKFCCTTNEYLYQQTEVLIIVITCKSNYFSQSHRILLSLGQRLN